MTDKLIESLKLLLINSMDPKTIRPTDPVDANIEQSEVSVNQIDYIKDASDPSFRILDLNETLRFNIDSLNYIYFLEQIGLLSAKHREKLFNHLQEIEHETITCNDIKWCLLSLIAPSITKEQQIFLDFVLANTKETRQLQ